MDGVIGLAWLMGVTTGISVFAVCAFAVFLVAILVGAFIYAACLYAAINAVYDDYDDRSKHSLVF